MNKIRILMIIQHYLWLVNYYWNKFYEIYKKRKTINNKNYEVIPHWSWVSLVDKRRDIRISFDYYNYNCIYIKYFEIWKLWLYIKENNVAVIELKDLENLVNELMKEWYISKDKHNKNYLYLTSKGENEMVKICVNKYN